MSWCLIGMTRVTMCLGLYFLCRLLSRYTANRWIVFGGCLAFACQHAVLDYSGAGTSYVAGVCFMITAIYFVLEAAQGDGRRPSSYAPMWRELNATYILEPWAKGGDIWIANRMLAQRPKPEWLWTEGDDPFTKWNDVYAFYHQFEYADAHLGGEDGFTMIKDSPSNRQILEPLVKKYADWLLTQQHSSSPAETSPNK